MGKDKNPSPVPSGHRSPEQVISQAISDNRPWEWLCFGAAVLLVLAGTFIIVRAVFVEQSVALTVAGTVADVLFWPAIRMGQRIRKENMAIRLLEIPLSTATSEAAAADMLHKLFLDIFVEKKG